MTTLGHIDAEYYLDRVTDGFGAAARRTVEPRILPWDPEERGDPSSAAAALSARR